MVVVLGGASNSGEVLSSGRFSNPSDREEWEGGGAGSTGDSEGNGFSMQVPEGCYADLD